MKRRYRLPLTILLVVVVLLLAIRLALPDIVRHELNARMADMGDYSGHIDDVDLHLWRGAYSLDGLTITKVSGKVPVPLLDTPHMNISLSWHALWHGAIRAKVDFKRPVLNFVDGSGHSDTQAGTGVDWRVQLQKLVPIQLDQVRVDNGTVTFHNFISKPRVDLKATEVDAVATNLTNASRKDGARVATFRADAKILGGAPLHAKAAFDPLSHMKNFSFQLRVLHIDLTKANSLARAYAGLDFDSGHGDFVMELDAKHGHLDGYAKPLFKDMKIFSWKQDVEKGHEGPLHAAWEAVAQGVTWLFKNHEKNQFATRVPIHGSIDDKKLGTMQAVVNVLHNAFVKAYTPQLEHLKPAPKSGKD
ncbi:DUF748 domain-containing protein [Oleiagrimonas sp. C23AA]|uniref:DUF748 domain-containing protein n=1 Tax=Oleiagrimonas sp. C23AA TaxID=2719047 RepID=UPI0014218E24|nr:DUF748 domain-containing protein [Oleiagrimonas sp. C23AA]